jgi:hypothetical protein
VLLHRHHRTLEAPLPQVADEAVLTMVIVDVGAQQPGHSRRQLPGLGALQEKVKMVVHPTGVQKPDREGLAIPVQKLEEVSVVAFGLEPDLAVMASIHHMIIGRPHAVLLSGYTRHGFPQLARSPNVLSSPLWTRFIPRAVAGKVLHEPSPSTSFQFNVLFQPFCEVS